MDALSEALSTVHLSGAVFFNAEMSAPWGFASCGAHKVAHQLAPNAEGMVIFHLVTEGKAVVRVEGEADVHVEAGDLVVLVHGDPHEFSNGNPTTLYEGNDIVTRYLAGDLSLTRFGGGGEITRFVCGFFACERRGGHQALVGLPRIMKVNLRGDESGAWLEGSIRHLVAEATSGKPGGMVLMSRMAEALFVEALRRHIAVLPDERTGWLAGARDPIVGAALVALHHEPARRWTVPELAAEVGASRSVLSERFQRFIGDSPMGYLARWRMQLASRLLKSDRRSILQVAMDVGYESEAAFNRAFKREFGQPPAHWRRAQAVEMAAGAA
jgi:AraC-like DNA-binding protein